MINGESICSTKVATRKGKLFWILVPTPTGTTLLSTSGPSAILPRVRLTTSTAANITGGLPTRISSSVVFSHSEGWRNDMARIYITLGEPAQRQKLFGLQKVTPMEIWFYSNANPALPPFFYVIFYQRDPTDEFRIYHPYSDGPERLITAVAGPTRQNALTFLKARELWKQGKDPQDCVDHLNKAVKSYAQFADAYVLLGTSYIQQNNAAEAKSALNRAIEIDPKLADARFTLGTVQNHEKDYAGAEKTLNEGLKLTTPLPRATTNWPRRIGRSGDGRTPNLRRRKLSRFCPRWHPPTSSWETLRCARVISRLRAPNLRSICALTLRGQCP